MKDIELIIEKFPGLERFYLGFMVSEPTLNPEFIEIVKLLKSINKKITISTNGNTFSRDDERSNSFWENLLPLLKLEDKIIWPIDGFDEDTYQKYRIGGKLTNVIFNLKRALKINPNINHTVQTILFKHNEDDIKNNYSDFKDKFKSENINWSLIDCCGDCSMNSNEVLPIWDKTRWEKLRKNPPVSKKFNCESKENRIIFMDHLGRIGFCPTQLTNSTINGNPITLYNTTEEILDYCNSVYLNKHLNKLCQFNCGTLSKLQKIRAGLDGIATQ